MRDLHEVMDVATAAALSSTSIFESWDQVAGVRHDEILVQHDREEVSRKLFFRQKLSHTFSTKRCLASTTTRDAILRLSISSNGFYSL